MHTPKPHSTRINKDRTRPMNRKKRDQYHTELMSTVKKQAKPLSKTQKQKLANYIGTNKIYYAISTEAHRKIIKDWIKQHPNLNEKEYTDLLTSLYEGQSVNEISIAGSLLRHHPRLRRTVKPEHIDIWLNRLQGWAEVDSLCQSNFSAEEVLTQWDEWQRLLTKLASDDNVHKKRASLVLLTKPVRDSEDPRLEEMAFRNIDKLKQNRHILVTKAISWLLRDLIKHHRQKVETYLRDNEDTLPRIAIRETRTKLLTGKKTPTRLNKRTE